MTPPEEDVALAHRRFAAGCFNRAWELLDLPQRSPAEVEEMLHAAHASAWHWLHVPGRTATNDSIGYWQLARVYALAGRAEEALAWGRRCLETSAAPGVDEFYLAYAHEACARAQRVAGREAEVAAHLAAARALLPRSGEDADDRARLAADLDQIERAG